MTDDTDNSKPECDCQECARLQATLTEILETLEEWLEMAHYNGRVVISEKILDDKLSRWTA